MSLQLSTQIKINATSQEIWKELTDFSSYPSWNPFITNIEGTSDKNNQLKAKIGGMNFKPIVFKICP